MRRSESGGAVAIPGHIDSPHVRCLGSTSADNQRNTEHNVRGTGVDQLGNAVRGVSFFCPRHHGCWHHVGSWRLTRCLYAPRCACVAVYAVLCRLRPSFNECVSSCFFFVAMVRGCETAFDFSLFSAWIFVMTLFL